MTTFDDYRPTARSTPADRTAGLRALSGLTAALVLGSVVGTGVIGVELLTHTTATSTATSGGTSAGVSSSQSPSTTGSGLLGGLLGGGSGSAHATSGGS